MLPSHLGFALDVAAILALPLLVGVVDTPIVIEYG